MMILLKEVRHNQWTFGVVRWSVIADGLSALCHDALSDAATITSHEFINNATK